MAILMTELEEIYNLTEVPWEDRTLHLLKASKIDQEMSRTPKPSRNLKMKDMKYPKAIPQLILDLQQEECREASLRALSNYLVEKREEDPENYERTGFLLFHSCATLTLLLQEVLAFYTKMMSGCPNVRCCKRLVNVVTLFQSIAANIEVREKFVNSGVPNFLIPIIIFKSKDEVYERIRSICLSVIGILCQAQESNAIQWAHKNNMIEVCQISLQIGHEISQVIATHILEAMLHHTWETCIVCNSNVERKLRIMLYTFNDIVSTLAMRQTYSPRLLFHIIRCYVLLCTHPTRFVITSEYLPPSFTNGCLSEILEEFPSIGQVLSTLFVCIGIGVKSPLQKRSQSSLGFRIHSATRVKLPIF